MYHDTFDIDWYKRVYVFFIHGHPAFLELLQYHDQFRGQD